MTTSFNDVVLVESESEKVFRFKDLEEGQLFIHCPYPEFDPVYSPVYKKVREFRTKETCSGIFPNTITVDIYMDTYCDPELRVYPVKITKLEIERDDC